jgi:hypothetical protein
MISGGHPERYYFAQNQPVVRLASSSKIELVLTNSIISPMTL